LRACQENIVKVLKDTASKAELEQIREGVIVASEMVRSNIADLITATAARISKTELRGKGEPGGTARTQGTGDS
jgi:hypothetical protein